MPETPTADEVRRWRDLLVAGCRPGGSSPESDTARVDLLTELEALKSAACAVQADVALALEASTRSREARAGVPAARRGRGVAAEVGLARRTSPHRGRMLLGLARELATDLPATRSALLTGRIDEHAAMVVARESGCLDREQRARLDDGLLGVDDDGTSAADGLGPRELAAEVRRRVAAADPAAVVRRQRRAEAERCVTLRPAPDTMAYLTALVPLTQGVACLAALGREADSLRATSEAGLLGRGQVMADLLVQRLTGQAHAAAVPIVVDLVVSDDTLLAGGHEPAELPGWGPVPAQVAREVVAGAVEIDQAWLRRLYADPAGHLVALSTRSRLATDGLVDYLRLRDRGICRTPWCDAPARHTDHVVPAVEGGSTDATNTQGLCVACNHAKQAPGWRQTPATSVEGAADPDNEPDARHTVVTTTPTGHVHRSRAPALPPPARGRPTATRLSALSRPEVVLSRVLLELAS